MSDATHDPDDFVDPLENYEPRKYDDPLEEALVEEELTKIRHEPFTTISPKISIQEAVQKLAKDHIACLLVTENEKLVGVLAERDVLNAVAANYDAVKEKPVRDVMTSDPIYVYETDSAVSALSVMAMCGFRHVPVVDLNDNLVGIVSPQRVTEFLTAHFKR